MTLLILLDLGMGRWLTFVQLKSFLLFKKVAKKLVKVKIRKPLGYVMAGNYGKELRWQACLLSGCQSVFSTLDERKTQIDG